MAKIFAMTGGATGIGEALKEKLIAAGDKIIVVDIQRGDVTADLSTAEGRATAVEGIAALAPDGLDGFIACAGLGPHVEPPSIIDRVNYFGAVATIEGVKELVARRKGSIVAVSSNSASMEFDPGHVEQLLAGDEEAACAYIDAMPKLEAGSNAYCGSKRAFAQWTRINAPAYAQEGVRLNAIAPGPTQTPLVEAASADDTFGESMQQAAESIPMGYKGQPDMIADAIVFMLSDAARFMAGAVLFVDGGQDALMRPKQF